MSSYRLSYGLSSDKGDVRETNQDAASAHLFKWGENDAGLFMVADGMGAKGEAERAAQIAVETVMEMVTEAISRDGVTLNFGELLTGAFQKANAYIVRETPNSGATLTAALIVGDMLYIAHVGDTRAYRSTEQEIVQLTKDHALYQKLISAGPFTTEPDETKWGNVLYRALGQSEDLNVDNISDGLHSNSWLLICSDGLVNLQHDYIKEPELQTILRGNDPQAACDRLVTLARERGSADDITALVVRVSGG